MNWSTHICSLILICCRISALSDSTELCGPAVTSSELLSAASYVTSLIIWLKTVFPWIVTCFPVCSKVWGLFVSLCLSLAAFRSCERTKRCTCFSSLWQHVSIWHQRRRMWVVTSSTWDKDIVNITIRESHCERSAPQRGVQSVLRHRQTPCSTQCEWCLVVDRSASNTNPTPMAFLRADVV